MGRMVATVGRRFNGVSGQNQTNPGAGGIFVGGAAAADSLHSPCDLVMVTSRSLNSGLGVKHPDGDIALRIFEGTESNSVPISRARHWGFNVLEVVQLSDGDQIASLSGMAAFPAFGCRVVVVDEERPSSIAQVFIVDPVAEWTSDKLIWFFNTSDQRCKMDVHQSSTDSTVVASVEADPGEAIYADYSGSTQTNPRVYFYYWDGADWVVRSTRNIAGGASLIPRTAWAKYDTEDFPLFPSSPISLRVPFNAFQ